MALAAPRLPVDPELPASLAMLHEPAPLLAAALGDVEGLARARPRRISWSPGSSLTVAYEPVTGGTVVAVTGRVPRGAATLSGPDGEVVGVWQVPHDPRLPGLASLMDDEVAGGLLDDLGAHAGPFHRSVVAYRPGRRAVVRLTRGRATVFLKAVQPAATAALRARHSRLQGVVPVPTCLGVDAGLGLVAFQGLGDTVLRTAAIAGSPVPGHRQFVELLDRLPAPDPEWVTPGWRSCEFASLLSRLRPDRAAELADLAGSLEEAERALGPGQDPVHGDLHEAQLLVAGASVTGLLDVDTYGAGRRLDDLANLLGHLSVLAQVTGRRPVTAYAAALLAGFDDLVDPAALRFAVGAVVLGLATGPFRVVEDGWDAATDRRIDLAASWVASARGLSERDLTATSRSAHGGSRG